MKLFYSSPSPFSAKVRMAARLCDIALEEIVANTQSEPHDLLEANPLGKIPTLVLDDGGTLYDSRVICEYFDRLTGNRIVPQTNAEWIRAKRLEATADGITDAAVLVVYEGRYRPEELHHQPWVDRQWRKVSRGLTVLDREIGDVPADPTVGHLSAAASLAFQEARFPGQWEENHAGLCRWADRFFEAFPALADVKPKV